MAKRQKGQAKVETIALEKLNVTYVDMGDVKPNPYNPNRQSDHEFGMLKASIETDGFTQPVIVQSPEADFLPGHIVDGEHRWRAAADAGLTQIPVVYVKFTEEQMKISTIRHNTARGSHDVELEAEVLRDLEKLGALDFAQDALGLDDVEIQRLIEDIQAPEGLAGEDFAESWDVGIDASTGAQGGDESQSNNARVVSGTPEAVAAMRAAEKAAKAANTEEERQAVIKDLKVFRLMLSFPFDKKAMIESVLGDEPAVKILELIEAANAQPDNS
jgi:ParB-like chromosome segregation protein Spo0J